MTGPTYKNIRSAPWVLTLRFPSNGSKRTMLFGLSQWLGIFVLINPSSSLLEPSSFKSDQLINQKSVVWVFFFFPPYFLPFLYPVVQSFQQVPFEHLPYSRHRAYRDV